MENQGERRQSFVDIRRKSLTFSNIFNDKNDEVSAENPLLSIKSYYELLVKEKEDWKEIFKQKKNLCKESEEKYKNKLLTIDRNSVEKYISASDKMFLESKPNYLEMINSVQTYVDAVTYLNKYKSDIIEYYNKACNDIEINNKFVIDEMCSADLCDICNAKNCNIPDHKFAI